MSFVYSIPCISKPRVTSSNLVGRANKSNVFVNFILLQLFLSPQCPVIVLFDSSKSHNSTQRYILKRNLGLKSTVEGVEVESYKLWKSFKVFINEKKINK